MEAFMNIAKKILIETIEKSNISDELFQNLTDNALREIQNVLINYNNDDTEIIDMLTYDIEEIVTIMNKYGFNCGKCHDF